MANYIMERKGFFKSFKSSDNQCKGKGHLNYSYQIKIAFSRKCLLDKSYFLIDHQHIDDVIQKITFKSSCEVMHQNILKELKLLFYNKKLNILAIKTTIKPIKPEGMAELTYIYSLKKDYLIFLSI